MAERDSSPTGPPGAATLVLRGHVLQVGMRTGPDAFAPPDGPRVATWTVVAGDPAAARATLAAAEPDLAEGRGTLLVGDPGRIVGTLRTAAFDGVLLVLPGGGAVDGGAGLLDEVFRVLRNGGLLGWMLPDAGDATERLSRMNAAGFRPVAFSGAPPGGSAPVAAVTPAVLVATKSADGFGLRFSSSGDVVMGPR